MQNVDLRNAKNSAPDPLAMGADSLKTMEFRIWMLMTTGFMVVCFANAIVSAVIPVENYQSHLREGILRDYASVLRILGVMIFAAGLVERVVLAISRIKL